MKSLRQNQTKPIKIDDFDRFVLQNDPTAILKQAGWTRHHDSWQDPYDGKIKKQDYAIWLVWLKHQNEAIQ